jgi:hypothetical protein
MRNWKVLALFGLVSLILAGAVLAEIVSPAIRVPEYTSINVVCLYNDFPTRSQVYVYQIDGAGNLIPGTSVDKEATNGFASFRVQKNRNYGVRGERIYGSVAERRIRGYFGRQRLENVTSAAVVGVNLVYEDLSK